MKKISSYLLATLAIVVATVSCKKDPAPVPDPEQPVISSAKLTDTKGEKEINVGDNVLFNATASTKNSTLASYEVSIKLNGVVLGSAQGSLTKETETVSKEITLTIPQGLVTEDCYPSVVVKFTNKDSQEVSQFLEDADNVKILGPKFPETLFLVDNNNVVYNMTKKDEGKFVTSDDITNLGNSFKYAENVIQGEIDWTQRVWGHVDGHVALISQVTGDNIPVPDSEGFGLIWLGFDAKKLSVEKMINFIVNLDLNSMADDSSNKVFWNMEMHRDCKVTFANYPKNANEMVQCDRFDFFDGNTARYTGQTNNWEVYYIPSTSWIVVKDFWNVTGTDGCLWITGENAGLPMQPYCQIPINWFANGAEIPTSAISCVKGTDDLWYATAYFKANFGFKIYDGYSWANELQWTSVTPETLRITPMEEDPETHAVDGNYGVASDTFVEGLYTFFYNPDTQEAGLIKY